MKTFYLTTSIVYPNAKPHIGYAMELVQADFLARYQRLRGREVYFLTGTDEHGLKIQQTAEKAGQDPKAFVDGMAGVVAELGRALSVSADRFIRTTDADHEQMAQALWRACEGAGDIYKKRYRAWYDVKEEEFLGLVEEFPDPAVFGRRPEFIKEIDEENYFFALSRYKDRILEALSSKSYQVVPEYRLQEVLNFVEQKGLEDISISREKEKLSWGVAVPGDEGQVMYVWFDALANYLTAAAELDGEGRIVPGARWPADVHLIGKDITRFHALIWTGMLLSAGLELPKQLLVHGFINVDGQKMSKSIGNVVDPFQAVEEHGVDPLRWYLLKECSTSEDSDYSDARVREVFTADLANDYGNLVSRVWTMCQKYTGGVVPVGAAGAGEEGMVHEVIARYHAFVEARQFDKALAAAHELVAYCNRLIDEKKPWVMAKDPAQRQELERLLSVLLEIVRHYSLLVMPALPASAERVLSQLFAEIERGSFEGGLRWGLSPAGSSLGSDPLILFPKPV